MLMLCSIAGMHLGKVGAELVPSLSIITWYLRHVVLLASSGFCLAQLWEFLSCGPVISCTEGTFALSGCLPMCVQPTDTTGGKCH
eukprot:6277592-Amphidinium_carterae.1